MGIPTPSLYIAFNEVYNHGEEERKGNRVGGGERERERGEREEEGEKEGRERGRKDREKRGGEWMREYKPSSFLGDLASTLMLEA